MSGPAATDDSEVPAVAAAPEPGITGRRDAAGLIGTAVVSILLGLATYGAAVASDVAVVVVVGVVQAALILTWMLGRRVPGRIGGIGVLVLAAAATDVLSVVFPRDELRALLPPLGLVVLAIFVAQLFRGVVRLRVVESVSDIALLAVAVIALGTLIQLRHGVDGAVQLEAVGAAVGGALAVGALVDLVAPVPRFDPAVDRGLLAVILGGAAGAALGYLVLHDAFEYGSGRSAFLGAALGVVATLLGVGASFVRSTPLTVTSVVGDSEGTAGDDLVGPSAVDPAVPNAATGDPIDPDLGLRNASAPDVVERDDAALGGEAGDVIVDEDVVPAPTPSRWPGRVQPIATTLWAFAIAAPIGYLLTLALGG